MSLQSSLISYWKLDGNSDDSIGSNNGSNTFISYGDIYGKINNGANFSATGSRITLSSILSKSKGSINMWFKASSFSVGKILFSDRSTTALQGAFQLQAASDSKLKLLVYGESTWSINIESANTFSVNTWYMLTWTWDATNGHKLYVNKTLWASSSTIEAPFTGSNDVLIGNLYDGNYGIAKYMDEVGLFSEAITVAEITTLYNDGDGKQPPFSTTNFFNLF